MPDWQSLPNLEDTAQILPWVPAARKHLSPGELIWCLALSALVAGAFWLIEIERRRGRITRLMAGRHRILRAPFYRFLRSVLPPPARPQGA